MTKTIYNKLMVIILLISATTTFGQGNNGATDPLDRKAGESKYYKKFRENLYQEDKFDDEITDKSKESNYYRVFFNSKGKPDTVGYYMAQEDKESRTRVTKLSQHVNRDQIPYYTIKYRYSEENEELVQSKILKDPYGRIIAAYTYYWGEKNKKLTKLERYGKTQYLYQMELKSFYEIKWTGTQIDTMTFYNKSKQPIEQYVFNKDTELKGLLTSDIPEFALGNNKIFIGYLSKYQRYRDGSTKDLIYYISFKKEGEGLLEEKFNNDGVLLKEKFHRELPKMDDDK